MSVTFFQNQEITHWSRRQTSGLNSTFKQSPSNIPAKVKQKRRKMKFSTITKKFGKYNLVPEFFKDQGKSAGIQHLKDAANKIYLKQCKYTFQFCHFDQKHLRNQLHLKLPLEKRKFISFKQHIQNCPFISVKEKKRKRSTKLSQYINKLTSYSFLLTPLTSHTCPTHTLTHVKHAHTIYMHTHSQAQTCILQPQVCCAFFTRGLSGESEVDHTGCQLRQKPKGIK